MTLCTNKYSVLLCKTGSTKILNLILLTTSLTLFPVYQQYVPTFWKNAHRFVGHLSLPNSGLLGWMYTVYQDLIMHFYSSVPLHWWIKNLQYLSKNTANYIPSIQHYLPLPNNGFHSAPVLSLSSVLQAHSSAIQITLISITFNRYCSLSLSRVAVSIGQHYVHSLRGLSS